MKNINTFKLVLSLVSIFVIVIVAIGSCKKTEEITSLSSKSSKLLQFYDSKLVEAFKQEPIAKEFLQEINKIPIKIVNGILTFNSVEDYSKVYDLIISYTGMYDELLETNESYSKYADWEQMPEDIMAFLFESEKNFYSLRANVEEQLQILQRGNGIPEENDPDDHYIVSPFQRTLLSPDCEVIVNDLICVFYDTYYIGIMNKDWETLKELHQWQKQNNFEEEKALAFCSRNKEAFFLTTGSEPTIHADFIYNHDPKNKEVIQFINWSYSEEYKDLEYLWDFGDGKTSIEKNPEHAFNSNLKKEFLVTLTVTLPNLNGSKGMVPGVVATPIHIDDEEDEDMPNFTFSGNNGGIVSFICNTHSPASGVYFSWNFGDGSAIANFSSDQALYLYAQNGYYNVKLTVHYGDGGHSETRTKTVQITNTVGVGACWDNDRDVDKESLDYKYNGEDRRIKQVIRVTNNYLSHRMVSKTKYMRKNSAGSWVMKNADLINTGFKGDIYNTSCLLFDSWDDWHTNGAKTNHYQRVWDFGLGHYNAFNVKKRSLSAQHHVVADGIVKIQGVAHVAVHNKE